jgi:hypothetical protein
VDPAIGVYIIDRYTYYALEFLENVDSHTIKTLGEFVSFSIFLDGIIMFFAVERVSEASLHFYGGSKKGLVQKKST